MATSHNVPRESRLSSPLALTQVPVQAVGPGAAAERRPQHGRPDVEHGEGAAGQRAVLRQGEPRPGLQVLHVPDAHHEAGGPQPDHGESQQQQQQLPVGLMV